MPQSYSMHIAHKNAKSFLKTARIYAFSESQAESRHWSDLAMFHLIEYLKDIPYSVSIK